MVCLFVVSRGSHGRGEFHPTQIGCRQAQTRSDNSPQGITRSSDMGPHAASTPLTFAEEADELVHKMMEGVNDKIVTKLTTFDMVGGDVHYVGVGARKAHGAGLSFLVCA